MYRAYLLKINSTASLSRTFGTVFVERIFDLFAIAILGLAAGFWSFRTGLPPSIQLVAGAGVGVVILLAIGMVTMRNFGRRILVALPIPGRIVEFYDRFEEGVFGAMRLRQLPFVALLTGLVWATESMRLFFVVQALNLPGVEIGLSGAVFVALIGSLLTAVPLSPAGLGIVEAGVVGVLTAAYGISFADAATIALIDRMISVFSVIILGAIAYVAVVQAARRGPHPGIAGVRDAVRGAVAPAAVADSGTAADVRLIRARTRREPQSGRISSRPGPRRPDRTRHKYTERPRTALRLADRPPYERVIQGRTLQSDSGAVGEDPTTHKRSAQTDHDEHERTSLQRMASSPAEGQEDVPAPARPAVRRRPLDDLPAHSRRPDAVARHRHEAGTRSPRAAGRRRYPPIPRPGYLGTDEPDRSRRIRPSGRRAAVGAPGPPDHGVLPRRPNAALRSDNPAVRADGSIWW